MSRVTFIKITLVIFLLASLVQFGWLIYLWFIGASLELWYWIWLGLASFLTLVVAGLTIFYRKRIWPHDEAVAERRALRLRVKRQFAQARTRTRLIRNRPEAVLWNIFIAPRYDDGPSTVMAELGYVAFGDSLEHKGLTITTWTSPTAVAYKIDVDSGMELSFDLLNLVFKELFKNRPTLAVNAAHVEIDLSMLMETPAVQVGGVSTINRILNVAAYEFGIDIPIHVALVGLEKMRDLSRAAVLTGHLNNGVIFGGFFPEVDGGIEAQVDALFSELIKNLSQMQIPALQKQLLPEFCCSLLNAPLQLLAVSSQVRNRMASLVQPLPPRTEPLNIQSIAFVGARDGMPVVDPLAQVSSQRFFSHVPTFIHLEDDSTSVTAENAGLLARAYHSEGFLVRPNRAQTLQRNIKASLWTLGLTIIVSGFSYSVWENYQSYRAVNDRLEAEFTSYFEDVTHMTTDSDFLVERVLLLQPLRDGLAEYAKLDAQIHRSLLPSFSMEHMYQRLYDKELVDGFQTALIDFLEKEMFAFNSINDGVELIQLSTIQAQIYSDQVLHKADLIDYFSEGLAEQGEVSSAFQDRLKETMNDLFILNHPPSQRNQALLTVVSDTLAGRDKADLFYQALMRSPKYSAVQDLRQLVGPRFSEVFVEIDNPKSYLVPRAYTLSGFNDLFVGTDIPDLVEILRGYQSAIGDLDNATVNTITRRVAKSYIGDYIARWSSFIQSLELRRAENWSDAQILLSALTNNSENPIEQLVSAIAINANIEVYAPQDPVEAPAKGDVPSAAPVPPKLASPSSSMKAAAAFNIRSAFRPYLAAMEPGQDQKSQFDLFLTYARNVNLWLLEATNTSDGTGQFLFTQFQNPEAPNPLAAMSSFVSRSDLDFIRSFGRSIVAMLDESAMEFVRAYIDGQWERLILVPHQAALTQNFPFAPDSDADISLVEFGDLFGAKGKIRIFEETYLASFKTDSGKFEPRRTFLLSGRVDLTNETKKALTRYAEIAEVMFVDGKPYLEFAVRTGFMDSGMSRLTLTSGISLHQYTHGPQRWDPQSWPLVGAQDSTITLRLFRRARALVNETFVGPWSWFRLVQDGSGSIDPVQGVAEATFVTDGGAATLQFDAAVRFDPFAPQFFSGVTLPRSLFTEPILEPEKKIEPSDASRLLQAWHTGDPNANEQLINLRGRELDFFTRIEIQRLLAEAGYYKENLDGIFGPATRDALWSWRRDFEVQ